MTSYKAPVRDTQFLFEDVFNLYDIYKAFPEAADATPDLVNSILDEAGKFAEKEVHPINYPGHEEGCRWEDGEVFLPKGYEEALEKFHTAGWSQLSENPEYGGQGLPRALNGAVTEFMTSASAAFALYASRDGSVAAIERNASEELKQKYLPNLIDGRWGGPMSMTEPHCGSDLGLLRTKAEPQADGTYTITGTKMFITGGEISIAENSIHLLLARIPGSPEGIKGISLFIVPKFMVNDDGSLGERNSFSCGSIEHKMGLNASATCVMNYDGAKGWLISDINKGMRAMFAMVNKSRFLVGLQGTGITEAAYQYAVNYALDRTQMRSLTGPKNPDGAADPIIVHPDVRRMLLSQRAFAEGSRALNTYIGQLFDEEEWSKDSERKKEVAHLLDLLTPISKGFGSEMGTENTNLALQCFGGHGYIRENGVEQFVRDMRITQLYEGTTGIQGLDLLARKILGTQGEALKTFTKEINAFCEENATNDALKTFTAPLSELTVQWEELSVKAGMAAMEKTLDELGSASVDFLMYSGYVTLAYMWAKMAKASLGKDDSFYKAKLQTANFYYHRILPRTKAHAEMMLSGAEYLMDMDAEAFLR